MKRAGRSLLLVAFVSALSLPARADEPAEPAHDAPVAETDLLASAQDTYLDRARDVLFYALSLIGIRYRWGGASPQAGFDCSGFVRHVYERMAGLVLPRDSYGMARVGEKVSTDDLKPGDLVFFNTLRRPYSHVGIYLGEERFVHAPSAGKAVQVVSMTEPYWRKRYNGARRVR